MPPHFTPESLKFLRGLARHNDRAWFDPRKPIYERELRVPMLALIEEINHALAVFAPEHVRPPHKAMMRIYRDTRFDVSRGQAVRPYKTQIAAWWSYAGPSARMAKTSGAGFYLSLSAAHVTIAAGCYMPAPEQLLAGRKLRAALSELEGHRLTRPPRGFPASDPAVAAAQDLILNRQWGVSATLPAEIATTPKLLKAIATRFALAAPIVHFLNTAILNGSQDDSPR